MDEMSSEFADATKLKARIMLFQFIGLYGPVQIAIVIAFAAATKYFAMSRR